MHNLTGPVTLPTVFCWTRMGDESGEAVDEIVQRKDLERHANGGLFVWGVGNGLGNAIRDLIGADPDPRVLFSPIRSGSAAIDRNPPGLLLWLDYIGPSGRPIPLPEASFVTSRDTTATGASKATHYALFCRSDEPLAPRDLGSLRFAELRNLATQRRVGFSQVTAVVSRTFGSDDSNLEYRVVLSAALAAPHFVRLATPVQLAREESDRIDVLAHAGDPIRWKDEIAALKRRYRQLFTPLRALADPMSLFAVM